MKDSRPAMKWESRMIRMAKLISTFSKDPSTKVGAVIFNHYRKTVITTGYNGFPRKTSDKADLYEDRDHKYPRVVHAEANAIVEAAAQGVSTRDAAIAITHPPCCACAGLIIQAGITCVIFEETGDDMKRLNGHYAMQLFEEANITIIGVTLPEETL
jgi:dCMP deaminase